MTRATLTTLTDLTRDRLLQAAGEVFAEKGFRAATVREICRRAEVNVAAVNYHFRNKETLYAQTLSYAYNQADEKYPLDLAEGDAEQRLRHFVGNFLRRILDRHALAWQGKLIAREIAEPSAALQGLVEHSLKPRCVLLQNIVAELLGPHWDAAEVSRCTLSILGQCLMYRHARAVIEYSSPELIADAEQVERTARLITHFSLHGLRGLAAERHT